VWARAAMASSTGTASSLTGPSPSAASRRVGAVDASPMYIANTAGGGRAICALCMYVMPELTVAAVTYNSQIVSWIKAQKQPDRVVDGAESNA